MNNFADLNLLLDRIKRPNQECDWSQFHKPRDLAIALSLEASEVLEHFQWKSPAEMQSHLAEIGTEVATQLTGAL